MQIQTYLHFGGDCEDALNFYCQALGARIDLLLRYRESPEPPPPDTLLPGMENKVMHASLSFGDSSIMASDDCLRSEISPEGFQLSLSVANEAEARHCFSALAEGGQVRMELAKTFYSPCFGMLTDRFGVAWMVIVPAPMQ